MPSMPSASCNSAAEAAAERYDQPTGMLTIVLPTTLVVQNLDVKFANARFSTKSVCCDSNTRYGRNRGRVRRGKIDARTHLLGLVEPSAGSIRLGKHDLASTSLSAWRRAFGYVPQETILFHASVWDNLTLANPAASPAGRKRRFNAPMRRTSLRLCRKATTRSSAIRGRFRAGSGQRLGIARALLTNPISAGVGRGDECAGRRVRKLSRRRLWKS